VPAAVVKPRGALSATGGDANRAKRDPTGEGIVSSSGGHSRDTPPSGLAPWDTRAGDST